MLLDQSVSDRLHHFAALVAEPVQIYLEFVSCLFDPQQLRVLLAGHKVLNLHVDFPDVGFGCLSEGCEDWIEVLLLSEQLLTDGLGAVAPGPDLALQEVEEELVEDLPLREGLVFVDAYLGVLLQNPEHCAFVVRELGGLPGEISLPDPRQAAIDQLVFHCCVLRFIKEIIRFANERRVSAVSWKVGRFCRRASCRTRCAFGAVRSTAQTSSARARSVRCRTC